MAEIAKKQVQEFTVEEIQAKTGYSIDVITEALSQFGPVYSDEELETLKELIPGSPAPIELNRGSGRKTAGKLAKPKKDELAVAESRSVAPAQRPGLVDLNPIEPIKVRRTRSMSASSLTAHQVEDQAEQFEQLHSGMIAIRQRAEQTAKIANVLDEFNLNITLQMHGLPTDGSYEERLERWEQYLDDRAAQEMQAQQTIEQLGAEIAQMAAAAGIAF